MFGMCMDHQSVVVDRHFARIVSAGMCNHAAPPCFESREQWKEYAVAYVLSKGFAMAFGSKSKIDYCKDCSRSFKKQMCDSDRCTHPETVFILSDASGDVTGVSIQDDRKSGYWEKCMMGTEGTVVGMPPSDVIDSVLARLAKRRIGGRPKKEGDEC